MEWVETTGRTVEEALDAALDQLGIDQDEAEFEVLQEPKSWFLGRRDAPDPGAGAPGLPGEAG